MGGGDGGGDEADKLLLVELLMLRFFFGLGLGFGGGSNGCFGAALGSSPVVTVPAGGSGSHFSFSVLDWKYR